MKKILITLFVLVFANNVYANKKDITNINFKPSMSGNPKNKIPIIANGIWPRTTEVILKNLSSDPFKTKFQVACRKAANKTAIIMNVSIIKYLYSIRLILLI